MNEEIENLILEIKIHLLDIATSKSVYSESSRDMVEEINALLKYYK